jgi:glycosyltransferase involved in cell wall biosynthesis
MSSTTLCEPQVETTISPSEVMSASAVAPVAVKKSGLINVCHVSMSLQTGGLERLLVDIARRVNRDKFHLHYAVLTDIGHPAEEIKQLGFDVQQMNTKGIRKIAQIKNMVKYFRENQIQLVHTHNTYPHFYATIAARLAGVPVVVNTQHGRGCGPNLQAKWQFSLANLMTDRVLAVSEDAQKLCSKQDSWNKSKIETLWNGIDLSKFAYHGPKEKGPAITVCRLSPEKDIATMIRAVAIVVKQEPKFKLRIVGEGKERKKLELLTHELEMQDHIEFLGERQDVPQLLKESSLYLGSSLTEGISLTLLEAMAVGLPIVTTNVGGNPEIVAEGVTGRLVPAAQPEKMAEAICLMLQMKQQWSVMGQKSRQRVEKNFSLDRMIHDYESLYTTILREKHVMSGM